MSHSEPNRPPMPHWPFWVLLAMVVVYFALLIFGVKPWDLNLEAKIVAGEKIPLDDFIAEGLWFAAAANLVFCGLLLVTRRWWGRPAPAPATGGVRGNFPAWFWILLAVVVVGAGLMRYPRLHHSLWNDEEYSMRRYVFGHFQERDAGELRFRPVDWKTCFFHDPGANNHFLFSATGKVSLSVWQRFFATPDRPFSEMALRLPSFLAGLLGIAVVGVLLAQMGKPMLGLMAAFFLSIHPWHLRYSVEARGYSLLLLFAPLAVFFLIRAARGGRWRDWLLFGACQFAFMAAFPGALYYAVALNLGALGLLAALHREWHARLVLAGRLAVANLLSAMAFLQLATPWVRPARQYLERDISLGKMGGSWFFDLWSHVVLGVRHTVREPDVPLALGLNMLREANPFLGWLVFAIVPVLLVMGLVRAATSGAVPAFVVLPFFAAAGFAWVHNVITGNFLFTWYLIFLLPGLALALFLALELPWFRVRRPVVRNSLQAVTGLAFLAVFLPASAQPRALVRDHDRQPLRQTVAAMRAQPFASPEASPVFTAAVGTSCRQLQSYDPRVLPLDGAPEKNLAALESKMRAAEAGRVPLFVAYANRSRVGKENPDLLALLEDPARFEHTATLYGLEEMFSFRVVRYRLPAR